MPGLFVGVEVGDEVLYGTDHAVRLLEVVPAEHANVFCRLHLARRAAGGVAAETLKTRGLVVPFRLTTPLKCFFKTAAIHLEHVGGLHEIARILVFLRRVCAGIEWTFWIEILRKVIDVVDDNVLHEYSACA